MKIAVVALDIDGTLLDATSQLSPKTIRVVNEVQRRGVKVVLATGRRIKTSLAIAQTLSIKEPLIAHNGSLVYDLNKEVVTYNKGFSGEEFLPLLSRQELEGLDYFLHCQDNILFFQEPTWEWGIRYLQEIPGDLQSISSSSLDKYSIFHRAIISGPGEKIMNYIASVKDNHAGFRYITFKSKFCEVTVLEILNSKASKGMALQHLASQWGIGRENILAVGDDINDLEMIEWAGLGVAMGNAHAVLKESADMVCMDNSQEGIANLLESLVL